VAGHAALAVRAPAARGDRGDDHAVARGEAGDRGSGGDDGADRLVPEYPPRLDGRYVALEDVQVGAEMVVVSICTTMSVGSVGFGSATMSQDFWPGPW